MLKIQNLLAGLLALAVLAAAGCGNPTNAPSKQAVQDADAARLKAIEENPKLTPEQKEMQKKMMGLTPEGRGPQRATPPGK